MGTVVSPDGIYKSEFIERRTRVVPKTNRLVLRLTTLANKRFWRIGYLLISNLLGAISTYLP